MPNQSRPFDDDRLEQTISIPVGSVILEGTLGVPPRATGVVLFAHGSGSSRFSPRHRFVARAFRDAGLATLLLDLLSRREEEVDEVTRHHRFDIPMLADRLVVAIDWIGSNEATRGLPVGLFGASTGGGAALVAAAQRPSRVSAVVSRGGRPDLAADALPHVEAPTLLIVGGRDGVVIELNEQARDRMRAAVVRGAKDRAPHPISSVHDLRGHVHRLRLVIAFLSRPGPDARVRTASSSINTLIANDANAREFHTRRT